MVISFFCNKLVGETALGFVKMRSHQREVQQVFRKQIRSVTYDGQ